MYANSTLLDVRPPAPSRLFLCQAGEKLFFFSYSAGDLFFLFVDIKDRNDWEFSKFQVLNLEHYFFGTGFFVSS